MSLIGKDISISSDFISTPEYAHKIGATVFQIFLSTPRQINTKCKQDHELIKFSENLIKYDLLMVVHGSYMINLCHPKDTSKYNNSMKNLIQDLKSSEIIGDRCLGVIIHMGKNIKELNLTRDQAISNYVSGIQSALSLTSQKTTIILETGASQGTEVGSKLEELSFIYHSLNKLEKNRVKFCIDTCHIWATGYDISNKKNVRLFFKNFDNLIGIDKIACIHLNDSKTKLDSHVDRHADLGYGCIGSTGLKEFVRHVNKLKIPIITETPYDTVEATVNFNTELKTIKSWLSRD